MNASRIILTFVVVVAVAVVVLAAVIMIMISIIIITIGVVVRSMASTRLTALISHGRVLQKNGRNIMILHGDDATFFFFMRLF